MSLTFQALSTLSTGTPMATLWTMSSVMKQHHWSLKSNAAEFIQRLSLGKFVCIYIQKIPARDKKLTHDSICI